MFIVGLDGQLPDPTVQVLQDPASSAEKHAQNSYYSFALLDVPKKSATTLQ